MAYMPSTSDEDLLVQATGAPVLQSKQVELLMLKARKSKFNRINVFLILAKVGYYGELYVITTLGEPNRLNVFYASVMLRRHYAS